MLKIETKSCIKVFVGIFLLYLGINYWPTVTNFVGLFITAAMPLLLGCVFAYVLNILMSFYEAHYFVNSKNEKVINSRRGVCMIASFLTLVLVIFLLLKLVVPELIQSVNLLISQVPGAISNLVDWLETSDIIPANVLAPLHNIDWQSKIQQLLGVFTSGIGNVMGSAISMVSSVFSGVVNFVLAFIFAIYLLTGKEKLQGQFDKLMRRYMKNEIYSKTKYVLSVLNESFHKYIVGQCVEAVILGGLCMIGMMLLNIPYATMTGAVIAFTALIPVAGGYIGAGIGAFMILTVSPIKAIIFLIFIVILQQLEGNLIYPRVVGSSLGLPAIWVLAAVTIGGGMMGIVGMLLGVPLASTLYRLLKEDVNKGLEVVQES